MIGGGCWGLEEKKVTFVFRRSKKKDPGIYRLASFTLIPRKVMEQSILETISKYMKDKRVISSQHGISKQKNYLISLIAFCNEMTSSMGKTSVNSGVFFHILL